MRDLTRWTEQNLSIDDLIGKAEEMAERLGHLLARWEEDGKYSRVTWCVNCGLAAAIEARESDEQMSGSTLRVRCLGPHKTAPYWDRMTYPDYEEELR